MTVESPYDSYLIVSKWTFQKMNASYHSILIQYILIGWFIKLHLWLKKENALYHVKNEIYIIDIQL